MCMLFTACQNNENIRETSTAGNTSTPSPEATSENTATPESPDNTPKPEIDYNTIYQPLITEWETAFNKYLNHTSSYTDMLDFSFYDLSINSTAAYYAIYDIDNNGISELILRNENGGEDIISYIFTIKDEKPINIFGYNNNQPIQVPWSRGGAGKILSNGLIDCEECSYSIYKISNNGYTVTILAESEPYNYPDEADLAMADWKYYINNTQVTNYDSYVQALQAEGYSLGEDNELAVIDWKSLGVT